MNITKENLESAVQALNYISDGLARLTLETMHLKQSIKDALKTEPSEPAPSPTEKFKTESEAAGSATKPIQLKLPLAPVTVDRAQRLRFGDVGYEDEPNPNRQACGQIGGLATAGVKRAPCPDRRPRGTVMVKDMTVNEKRRYWRWSKFRAAQRASGVAPVSWTAWVGERG